MARRRTLVYPVLVCGLIVAAALLPRPALAEHSGLPHHLAFQGYDLKSGELLFEGERHATLKDGNVIERITYRDPAGTVFQEESAVYDAQTLELVSYSNVHLPTGKAEWAERSGNRIKLTARPKSDAPQESEELEFSPSMLVGSSIVRRVQLEPSFLEKGDAFEVSLLLPSALDTVGLRLDNGGVQEIGGRRVVEVRAAPSSWFLRQLVDPVLFYFGADDPHQLVESRGRTSARRPDGERYEARVVYRELPS